MMTYFGYLPIQGRAMMRAAVVAVVTALLAGCLQVSREPVREPVAAVDRSPAAEPVEPGATQPPAASQPSLAARSAALAHARAPARPLSLRANCSGRDPNGYAERIALNVSNGLVDYLDASVEVPRAGSCSFRLAQFRQTKRTPFVELLALREGSRCAVRIWTQGDRVTVAPTDCQEMCVSPGAFESVWPIALSARTGSCL